MALFTALRRELGLPLGAVTDGLIDAPIEAEVAETDDLDWKGELPPTSKLADTDFPKDIAAMANYGAGSSSTASPRRRRRRRDASTLGN